MHPIVISALNGHFLKVRLEMVVAQPEDERAAITVDMFALTLRGYVRAASHWYVSEYIDCCLILHLGCCCWRGVEECPCAHH